MRRLPWPRSLICLAAGILALTIGNQTSPPARAAVDRPSAVSASLLQLPSVRPESVGGAPHTGADSATAAYPPNGTVVLYESHSAATWIWDGNTWTTACDPCGPGLRTDSGLAYDVTHGVLVLFGGYTFDDAGYRELNDTWTWNGTTWIQQSPQTSPPARTNPRMAYDAQTTSVLLFGGITQGAIADPSLADTWTWDGTTWRAQLLSDRPSTGFAPAMASDPVHGTVVLYGLGDSDDSASATWTWNGTTWIAQSPAVSPPPRHEAAMSYDAATGMIVLFGGAVFTRSPGTQNPSLTWLNDTWLWDGRGWTQASPETSPAARAQAILITDPSSGNLTLWGGSNQTSSIDDAWGWDGSTWTQIYP